MPVLIDTPASAASKALAEKLSEFRKGITSREVSLLHFLLETSGAKPLTQDEIDAFVQRFADWATAKLTPEEKALLNGRVWRDGADADLDLAPGTDVVQLLSHEVVSTVGAQKPSTDLLKKLEHFDISFVASCHHPAADKF